MFIWLLLTVSGALIAPPESEEQPPYTVCLNTPGGSECRYMVSKAELEAVLPMAQSPESVRFLGPGLSQAMRASGYDPGRCMLAGAPSNTSPTEACFTVIRTPLVAYIRLYADPHGVTCAYLRYSDDSGAILPTPERLVRLDVRHIDGDTWVMEFDAPTEYRNKVAQWLAQECPSHKNWTVHGILRSVGTQGHRVMVYGAYLPQATHLLPPNLDLYDFGVCRVDQPRHQIHFSRIGVHFRPTGGVDGSELFRLCTDSIRQNATMICPSKYLDGHRPYRSYLEMDLSDHPFVDIPESILAHDFHLNAYAPGIDCIATGGTYETKLTILPQPRSVLSPLLDAKHPPEILRVSPETRIQLRELLLLLARHGQLEYVPAG